jgi:hypothetical protein
MFWSTENFITNIYIFFILPTWSLQPRKLGFPNFAINGFLKYALSFWILGCCIPGLFSAPAYCYMYAGNIYMEKPSGYPPGRIFGRPINQAAGEGRYKPTG